MEVHLGSTARGSGRSVTTPKHRAGAVGAAVVAALACWAMAEAALGIDVQAPGFGDEPAKDIGVDEVVISSLVAGLAGWALLATLERFTAGAAQVWSGAAVVVLVLSLGGPLAPGISTSSRLSLLCLHVAVAATLIPLLGGTAKRQSSDDAASTAR